MNYVSGHRNLIYVPDMVARNTQVYSEIELQSQAPAKIWLNFAKLVRDYAEKTEKISQQCWSSPLS